MPHHFGLYNGRVPERVLRAADKAAAKHGAWADQINEPGRGWRGWFSCPNRGAPFDQAIAEAVLAEPAVWRLFKTLGQ